MKETIFRYARSIRVRIISAFLAVLIFSLMFTSLFENLGFNKAEAATQVSGPNIAMNTNETGIDGWKNWTPSGSNYKYTGGILAQSATMYDYLSDEEVSPGTWNTGITKSRVSGYNDPYTQFNTYISNSNDVAYVGTSNITIVFQDFGSWAVGTDEVCIFMEDDNGHHNTWYGDRMTYISSNNTFKYTFNETVLGFTPTKIKIYNKNGAGTLPTTAEGKGFRFENDSSNFGYKENGDDGYKTGHTYYIKWRCTSHQGDHSHIWEASGADPIYSCKYDVPLYFGCFLSTGNANTSGNYNEHTAPNYNNFYWRANMAFRADTDASVQKLVDNTLKGGNITQNNVELPYFKSTNNTVMKSWSSCAFPFYEVLTDRGNATSYVSGTASTDTKAKFYQFNSADTNVYFDGSKFIEKENAVTDQESSKGYFPFNQSGAAASSLNLGFGTKFVIPFKLNSDGKVYAVNDQGKEVTGAGKVNARFEFEGDDDLWVFIDDNLILDMGGAHKIAKGYIDFAQQKAAVKSDGVDFSTSSSPNDLSTVLGSEKTLLSGGTFTNKLLGGYDTTVVDGKEKGYSTSQQHKMTVFYMERGMINSNLLIRFNFAAESNFSKMKIQEQTNFSTVNEGLKNAAKKAADYDVFKYTVSNSGTDSSTILNSSALYPTKENHVRNVQGTQTKLTSENTPYVSPNTESKCFNFDATNGLVKNTSYLWVDKFANMYNPDKGGDGKGTGLTDDTGGFLYLMYGTEDVESSAEFEGQFSRYSMMTVTQDSQLYKADSHSVNTTDNATTFSTGRTISNYYTVSKPYIYSRLDVTEAGRVELANDTTPYVFRNNIKDSVNENVTSYTSGTDNPDADLFSAVQMTEVFVNTVNVGAISVTKAVNSPSSVTNGETANSDRFEFTVQFTDVFGVSGVTVDDYTDITISGAKDSNGDGITKLLPGGKFYLEKGDNAVIKGIPVGTKYTITEAVTDYSMSTLPSDVVIAQGTLVNPSDPDYSDPSKYNADNTNVHTITNTRLMGSLVLEKAEGSNWDANSIPDNKQFEFTVTLTKPSTISFDNFKAYFSDVRSYTEDSTAGTLTRVFDMVKGTTQTISGIPSGTTYSVVETDTGGSESHTESNTSGTIGNGTVTATITNNYPAVQTPISLDIEKVDATNTDTKLSGATFDLYYSPEAQSTAATSTPVLSGTGSVQYEWTESTADNKLRLTLPTGWSSANLTAKFYNSGSLVSSNSMEGDTGSIYKVSVPASTYDSVVFSDGTNTSSSISLNEGNNYGKNYICALTTSNSYSAGSNKVAFDNTGTGWSAVYAYMWNSSNDTQKNANYPGVRITENSNGIYIAEITDNSYDRIIFNSGNNSNGGQSDSPKTLNLDLTSNVGKVFHPRISDRLMIKSGDINEGNDGQRKANYWTGSVNTQITGNSWDREYNGMTGNSRYGDSFEVPSNNYSSLQIYRRKDNDDTQDKWRSVTFTLNSTNNYGRGQVYKLRKASSSNNIVFEYLGIGSPDYADSGYWDNTATVWDINTYSGVSTTDCTATYQPEDRYSEANNDIYITVPDSITSPYVKFLDSSNALIGSATNGILLNGTDMKLNGTSHGVVSATDTTNSTTTYRIRLPKNAASFKVNNGDIYTLNDDAGAKFTVDPSTNAITRTAQRDGYDTTKPALTTDSYISFKDVNNEWNGTVFAYYFGGTNGEYSEWQGVSPFKSYTSGSDTIYVFQYPEGGTNDYPKVIFNSGAYPSSSNKTSAIQYEAGKIYASTSTTVTNFTPDSSQTGSWVKLATVETGIGGTIGKITWLKEPSSIDTDYLANTSDDIWDDSHTNRIDILVKVKKTGTYIWKEKTAPANYELAPDTVFMVTDTDRNTTVKKQIEDPKTPDPSTNEIILTKTAKEQVGEKAIGAQLKGAAFKLVKIQTSSNDETLRFNKTASVTDTNEYIYVSSGGTYNASGSWLTTGDDGRLHIKNLPNGDYYLEEQTASSGFVNTDSNDLNGGVAQPKKVYFSVGSNTGTKNITCSDEMNPAYIRLFEHINEKKTAWGNPTFIFKITQTQYYNNGTLSDVTSSRTSIVALTVNENGVRTDGLINHTDPNYNYSQWFEESTVEDEYQGMYHIDSQGRIRVEPGTYQITRVPVSRYKFVENTWKLDNEEDTVYTTSPNRTTTEALNVTIPATKTAIVHYYDTVEYYDKFSHVDTKVNKFYQLDVSTKKNKTVKGIRIKDITNVETSADTTMNITTDNKFKLYFIYVDGTESEITDSAEKEKLNITYSGSDSAFSNPSTGFSFSNNTITIKANTNFKNKVYTITASYDGGKFSTTFDLVFERTT